VLLQALQAGIVGGYFAVTSTKEEVYRDSDRLPGTSRISGTTFTAVAPLNDGEICLIGIGIAIQVERSKAGRRRLR
jgi:hypothetical protein